MHRNKRNRSATARNKSPNEMKTLSKIHKWQTHQFYLQHFATITTLTATDSRRDVTWLRFVYRMRDTKIKQKRKKKKKKTTTREHTQPHESRIKWNNSVRRCVRASHGWNMKILIWLDLLSCVTSNRPTIRINVELLTSESFCWVPNMLYVNAK